MGFYLFGTFIPYYGFFILIGIVCAYFFGLILVKKKQLDTNDYIIVCAYLVGFGFVGAKLFYIIVSIKDIDFSLVFSSIKAFNDFFASGFVFYGGLIGGLIAFIALKKWHNIDSGEYIKIITPSLGIAHCFGRIGCSFAGCCHGKITTSNFAFIYTKSLAAPNNVPLFPVQGIEAFCLLILSIICFVLVIKNSKIKVQFLYILVYSVLRFILEFFRGDSARGLYSGISTSQIVSICLFFSVIFLLVIDKIRKRKEELQ